MQGFVEKDVGNDYGRSFLPPTKEKIKGASASAKVSQLFPYRTYDAEKGLYFNEDSVGFALICAPATGLNLEQLRTLESIFTTQYRADTMLQISMIADPNVGELLSNWEKGRATGDENKDVFSMLAKGRVEHLKKASWASLFSEEVVMIRDYHLVITMNMPLREGQLELSGTQLDELERNKDAVIGSLKSASIIAEIMTPSILINIYGNLFRPDLAQKTTRLPVKYDARLPINEQVISNETAVYVNRDSLTIKYQDNYVSCLPYSVKKFPVEWMGSANGELTGAFFNRIQRIACPFIITMCIHIPDQTSAASKAQNNMLRATQMKDTDVGKYVPQWKGRHADWTYVVGCMDQGSRLIRASYQIVLFAPQGTEQGCEQSLRNVFSANGWNLVKDRFCTVPRVMSSMPMWIGRESFELMDKLKFFSTLLSWNAVNLAPWIAEWKGNVPYGQDPMLMFLGRRGQVCYLDPFLNTKGNFNIAVAAASGAGKSFFTQDYVKAILGSGGKAFIIDSGRSYENLCKILDGEYIDFEEGNTICLNPFTTILEEPVAGGINFSEQLPLLKSLIATMASPFEQLSSKHLALLEDAIYKAWSNYGQTTTITLVQKALRKSLEQESKDIAIMLTPYCAGGAYEQYFEGEGNINFKKSFVVLELEALNAKPDLQTVVLFLLMKRITEAMYLSGRSQRKICIIDEAWRLLGSGNSSLVIEEGFRICRKYNGSFMTVTQSLVDYYKSPTAAAAYANSDFVFLLRQKPESLAEIEMKGYLVMSPFEKRVYGSVTTFGGRYSEIAIKSPDGLAVGQLIVDKFSGKLMSTKAEDVHAIKMFEQQGFSKLEAIKKVALA
jgi:conjugal transfer ATP-binding protein TraC